MENNKSAGIKVRRVSDIIGDGTINFYPEYTQRDISEVLGKDFMLMDARIMKDWKSDYGNGTSDWCLLAMQDLDTGENFTTKCGGVVLTKRITELLARKALPTVGCIFMQGDSDRAYYNIK